VIEAPLGVGNRLYFLQEFGFLLNFYLEVTKIRRAQVRVLLYAALPHTEGVVQVALWLYSFNELALLIDHYHSILFHFSYDLVFQRSLLSFSSSF